MVAKYKWKLPGGWTWQKVNEHFRRERKKKQFIGRLKNSNHGYTTDGGPR